MNTDLTIPSTTISVNATPSIRPIVHISPVKSCANAYICYTSGVTFTTAADLHLHQTSHNRHALDPPRVDDVVTQCPVCDRRFTASRALTTHTRRTHPDNHRELMVSRKAVHSAYWSKEEDLYLLRLADELNPDHRTLKDLFLVPHQRFPMRSAVTLGRRLQFLKWKRPQNFTLNVNQRSKRNHTPAQPSTTIVLTCSDSTSNSDGSDRSYRHSTSFSCSSTRTPLKQPRMGL